MAREAQRSRPNRTIDGELACGFHELWLGLHPLCAAETARVCGVPASDVEIPDWSHLRKGPDMGDAGQHQEVAGDEAQETQAMSGGVEWTVTLQGVNRSSLALVAYQHAIVAARISHRPLNRRMRNRLQKIAIDACNAIVELLYEPDDKT